MAPAEREKSTWGVNCSLAIGDISFQLCNPKFRCRVIKTLPLFPNLSPIKSVHILKFCTFKVRFNIIFSYTPKSQGGRAIA
jgi:hypothetical protein